MDTKVFDQFMNKNAGINNNPKYKPEVHAYVEQNLQRAIDNPREVAQEVRQYYSAKTFIADIERSVRKIAERLTPKP